MRFTMWISGLAVLSLCYVGAEGAAQAAPIEIKISHATSQLSAKGRTWDYFKKLCEERLAGKVKVSHHHSAQLYGQREGIQALQAGAVQFISPGAPLMTGDFPKMAVFGLPLMFDPADEIRQAAASPKIGGKIFDVMPAKNLKFVSFWLNGYRVVGSRKGPIKSIEDLGKVKIRVPGGKIYRDTFEALGGNVVAVSWSEIVSALQQGTVDAIEPTANNWESQKLYEIATDITYTNHILSTYIVATNNEWWNSLPGDIRGELEKILAETEAYNWKMTTDENTGAVERMKAAGAKFYELDPAEKKRWFDRVKPIHKQYEDVIGKDILDAVYEIVE